MRASRSLKLLVAIIAALAVPAPALAQFSLDIGLGAVNVAVDFGPPALPVYVQPPCPTPNWIWTPGYWAWSPYGYYWVPGTWVAAPRPGLLWTPGYWGYTGGYYGWHGGYWASRVGFYGGINYGAGYYGHGYAGGGWYGNNFRYNTAVTNVNTTIIRNVYINRTVVNNYYNTSHVAYNGGPSGVRAVPTADERAVARLSHVPATRLQVEHIKTAGQDRNLLARVNGGHPAVTAIARPFTPERKPADFTPVLAEDRAASAAHAKTGAALRTLPVAGAAETRTKLAAPKAETPSYAHKAEVPAYAHKAATPAYAHKAVTPAYAHKAVTPAYKAEPHTLTAHPVTEHRYVKPAATHVYREPAPVHRPAVKPRAETEPKPKPKEEHKPE